MARWEHEEFQLQWQLAAAALLLAGMGVAHSYLGERYILIRLFRRADLPKLFGNDWFTRRALRFAWHLTTVAWWGLAAIVVLDATRTTLLVVAVVMAVSATITAVASKGRHLAWLVMATVAVLLWI